MPEDIFGLYPIAFIGLVLLIGIIGVIIYVLYSNAKARKQNVEESKGKLLCEFCSPEGSYEELCQVYKGQIKKVEASSRGTFLVNRFVKDPRQTNKSVDVYFVLQDHCFPHLYPQGKPREQQILVMKTHFLVNDPIPKISYNPEKWSKDVYDRVTSTLGKYAQDEKTMEVIMAWVSGVKEELENLIGYLKRVPLMLIGEVIIIILLLANIAVSSSAASSASAIIDWIRGL